MRWPWRRARDDGGARAVQVEATEALAHARSQRPRIAEALLVARALTRQADALAHDVERALRLP